MKVSKTMVSFILSTLFFTGILSAQVTIPPTLRQGIEVDEATIALAIEMQNQGWSYIMPEPKSAQARWGNTDGRTTWWIGYWVNKNTGETSLATPANIDGTFQGDGQGGRSWRRGGTPRSPSTLEWLLSSYGGIHPR